MSSSTYPPARLSWLVWGLGALFYFTAFYQRVAPAVMTDRLMKDFHIGAAALGNFSAFYFYSYVAMQIPTGMLADHWGPRKLLATGSLVAALGTLLFAMAEHLIVANMGRLLIGGSVAVAWVSLLKLASHWFSPRRFATVSGVALLVGVAGAVSAGVPLRIMVELLGWRGVMLFMSVATVGVGVGIWIVVRDDPSEAGYASYAPYYRAPAGPRLGHLLAGLREAISYRNTIALTLAPAGSVGSVLAFCGLWGVDYLAARYQLSRSAGAAITSTVMLAWALGGPAIGALSDRIRRRKLPYLISIIIGTIGWLAAIYIEKLPLWLFVVILSLAGFACGAIIIGFAFVKESVPPELAGTASGICNMGVMSGPMILQPAIGWMLDLQWKGTALNGARIYDLEAYRTGFLLMMVWMILSVGMIAITSETYCRQQRTVQDEGAEK